MARLNECVTCLTMPQRWTLKPEEHRSYNTAASAHVYDSCDEVRDTWRKEKPQNEWFAGLSVHAYYTPQNGTMQTCERYGVHDGV